MASAELPPNDERYADFASGGVARVNRVGEDLHTLRS